MWDMMGHETLFSCCYKSVAHIDCKELALYTAEYILYFIIIF